MFANVDDELTLSGPAILESIGAHFTICIKQIFEKIVERPEKGGKTTPETEFVYKLNLSLIIAEAQECIKAKKWN